MRRGSPIYISCHKVVFSLFYIYQRVYIRLPRRYLFVGHVSRHWGALAKRGINNRTIRHDEKGAVPIVYCLIKMHLWGSKLHTGIPFLCVFILDGALFGDDVKKFVSGLIILYDRRVAASQVGLRSGSSDHISL